MTLKEKNKTQNLYHFRTVGCLQKYSDQEQNYMKW